MHSAVQCTHLHVIPLTQICPILTKFKLYYARKILRRRICYWAEHAAVCTVQCNAPAIYTL